MGASSSSFYRGLTEKSSRPWGAPTAVGFNRG